MDLTERITIDPKICHGKPTIRGLRYPVEMILELLSSGMTSDETLADYEDLDRADMLDPEGCSWVPITPRADSPRTSLPASGDSDAKRS